LVHLVFTKSDEHPQVDDSNGTGTLQLPSDLDLRGASLRFNLFLAWLSLQAFRVLDRLQAFHVLDLLLA